MQIGIREIEEKYDVLAKMGEGGMGAIYKARHRLLDEVRVIKTIKPQLQDDEDLQARFQREARVAAKMRHPHIAVLHDFAFTDDGTAYIVMQYVDGENLRDFHRSGGQLSVPQVIEIGCQALDALAYLHGKSFIHRDISTDNMMIGWPDGRPQVTLIDLGLAKSLEGSQWRTKTGMVVGKVRYISPEQLNAGTEGVVVDARSDLYSFGVVLYELLTGEFPITGADDMSLIAGHLYRPPRAFSETDPNAKIPERLRAVVMRALEKDPAQRYPTAEAFADALRSVLDGDAAVTLDEQPTRLLSEDDVTEAHGRQLDPVPFTRAAAPQGLPRPQATQPVAGAEPAPSMGEDPTRVVRRDPHEPTVSMVVDLPAETPPATATQPTEQLVSPRSRSKALPWMVAAAVALVAALGWMVARQTDGDAEPKPATASADRSGSAGSSSDEALPEIFWGNYYALVIGNNDYQKLPKLEMAVSDAEAVARVLERRYGFEVTRLLNADRSAILDALFDLGNRLTTRDNLLIYYAGHGAIENLSPWWQPVDAEPNDTSRWIATRHEVANAFERIYVRHALVVSDSCFAGAVAERDLNAPSPLDALPDDRPEAEKVRQLAGRQSRLVLASGGLSPVLDAAGTGRHSVFAQAFLDALQDLDKPTPVSELYEKVAPEVKSETGELGIDQVPVLAPFTSFGDEGGELFFVPISADS